MKTSNDGGSSIVLNIAFCACSFILSASSTIYILYLDSKVFYICICNNLFPYPSTDIRSGFFMFQWPYYQGCMPSSAFLHDRHLPHGGIFFHIQAPAKTSTTISSRSPQDHKTDMHCDIFPYQWHFKCLFQLISQICHQRYTILTSKRPYVMSIYPDKVP